MRNSFVDECDQVPKVGNYQARWTGPENQPLRGAALRLMPVPSTDSDWDVAAHRCGMWLLARSSLGKDNVLAIHRHMRKQLIADFPKLPCLNELDIGRLTYAGGSIPY